MARHRSHSSAAVANPAQFLEQADQRQTFTRRLPFVRQQQLIELVPPRAENTGDVRCLTDAPLPFFVRVGLPVCVGIIFAAAGTGIVGMAAFGEPADPFRLSGLALIIAGMVGLKLASGH